MVTHLSHFFHAHFLVGERRIAYICMQNICFNTMKTSAYILLAIGIALLCACNATTDKKKYSPYEEQHVAHEFLAKANNVNTDDNEQRMMLFDKARTTSPISWCETMQTTPYVPMRCSPCDGLRPT